MSAAQLTLLCTVCDIGRRKLDHSIRYRHTLLDRQHPIHHIRKDRIELLFARQLGALGSLLGKFCSSLVDLAQSYEILAMIGGCMLDLLEDWRDESGKGVG
jgi:hypothetical protein